MFQCSNYVPGCSNGISLTPFFILLATHNQLHFDSKSWNDLRCFSIVWISLFLTCIIMKNTLIAHSGHKVGQECRETLQWALVYAAAREIRMRNSSNWMSLTTLSHGFPLNAHPDPLPCCWLDSVGLHSPTGTRSQCCIRPWWGCWRINAAAREQDKAAPDLQKQSRVLKIPLGYWKSFKASKLAYYQTNHWCQNASLW